MKSRWALLILVILALSLYGLTACEQEPQQLSAAGISKQSHEWVFAKQLTSTGPVDFDSTLNADGAVTFGSTLAVTGMVTGKSKVINKTGVTVALTAAEVQGTVVTDLGDTGSITFTLPSAVAGYDVLFINITGNDWIIDVADNADQIFQLTNSAGDKITNTTSYDQVHLIALDASGYYVADRIGTWADGN